MTFYLRPSEGSICTTTFHTFAECRLRYLVGLRNYENGLQVPPYLHQYTDCLIEGTAKDRVSHFALRCVSLLYPPLHSFVIQKEQILFTKRLFNMKYEDLTLSIKILRIQLGQYEIFDGDKKHFFRDTKKVLEEILRNRHLKHFVLLEDSNGGDEKVLCPICTDKKLVKVPFEQVLPLVSKREVELKDGEALLRCDQVPTFLTQLFVKLLEYSSRRIKETACIQRIERDQRFHDILISLRKIYDKTLPLERASALSISQSMNLKELDNVAKHFPPCMRAMHHTLRTRHRLCHKPRVQYTLYLKEIGLPVQDFLKLLEMEYSKPAVNTDINQKHNCEHSWGKDSRRYTYGTKHLYGMEGCKTNYSAHGCRTIQKETPSPNQCGGCPFAHFDKENLKNFLTFDLGGVEYAVDFMKQINYDKIQPIETCHAHLRFKAKCLVQRELQNPTQELRILENSQVKIHSVLKPKHYFAVMSNLVSNR